MDGGLRAELEAMGIIDRQPAIAPAVFASWGRGLFGAAVAVIVMPTIGVRAEGRLHLLEASRIRPLFGVGATLFGTAFAPRGVLGVTADVGPVRFSLDAAIEYFVSGPSRFQPLASDPFQRRSRLAVLARRRSTSPRVGAASFVQGLLNQTPNFVPSHARVGTHVW